MEQSERTSTQASKRCHVCKQQKPITEFYPNRARYDGLGTRCKDCDKAYSYLYKGAHRAHYTDLERINYHRIQDESGCHKQVRNFYPAYRFLQGLVNAEVVEI